MKSHLLTVVVALITAPAFAAGPATQPEAGGNAGGPVRMAGTVGVVDLSEVMEGVGWSLDLTKDRDATVAEGRRAIALFNDRVMKALRERLGAIGADAHLTAAQQAALERVDSVEIVKMPLTIEQKTEVSAYVRQAQEAENNANQQITQAVNTREANVVSLYQKAIKPAVRHVAWEKELTVVLAHNPQNETVFYLEPSADITNAVIDELRKATKPTMPEALTFNIPPFQLNPFGASPPVAGPTTRPR